MFKYVVTTSNPEGADRSNLLINFFHVREIGPLCRFGDKDYFEIVFADGTMRYGVGADLFKDVTDFAIALR